jgi:hypothetical protein
LPVYSTKPGSKKSERIRLLPSDDKGEKDPRAPAGEMFSLAEHFAMGTNTLMPAGATSSPVQTNSTFQDFFTSDAKLLGVLKLKDLIEFLDVTGGRGHGCA